MNFSGHRDDAAAGGGAHARPGPVRPPHPAVLILSWLILVVAMQFQQASALLATGGPLAVVAAIWFPRRLWSLLRNVRWIVLSALLIYGYVTPGDPVWMHGGILSPTLQGVKEGLLQVGKLLFALTGLSIVLGLVPLQQLVGAIYTLNFPLRYLGFSRERAAVRLALTLHYAEAAILDARRNWRECMDTMLAPSSVAGQQFVEIHAAGFTWRDALLLAPACAVLALSLL